MRLFNHIYSNGKQNRKSDGLSRKNIMPVRGKRPEIWLPKLGPQQIKFNYLELWYSLLTESVYSWNVYFTRSVPCFWQAKRHRHEIFFNHRTGFRIQDPSIGRERLFTGQYKSQGQQRTKTFFISTLPLCDHSMPSPQCQAHQLGLGTAVPPSIVFILYFVAQGKKKTQNNDKSWKGLNIVQYISLWRATFLYWPKVSVSREIHLPPIFFLEPWWVSKMSWRQQAS